MPHLYTAAPSENKAFLLLLLAKQTFEKGEEVRHLRAPLQKLDTVSLYLYTHTHTHKHTHIHTYVHTYIYIISVFSFLALRLQSFINFPGENPMEQGEIYFKKHIKAWHCYSPHKTGDSSLL